MNAINFDLDSRLLGDVGGTNARFAWQKSAGSAIENSLTLPCKDFDSLHDAIRAYLQEIGRPIPAYCAIGIANPVVGDLVKMTNHHWSFSLSELKKVLGLSELLVINDFTALAWALPTLSPEHIRQVGKGRTESGFPIGLTGPGTGLGVSGLIPNGPGSWIPIAGEGGHATISAVTRREFDVLAALSQRHGHVSAERILSGAGLAAIYSILLELNCKPLPSVESNAAAVVEMAIDSRDPVAVEALEMFCALLGGFAGNLALTIGAKGGVYIGGGIVPRLGTWFDNSPFRQRFLQKGRFESYLSEIPTFVIDAPISPALAGASSALNSKLAVPRGCSQALNTNL